MSVASKLLSWFQIPNHPAQLMNQLIIYEASQVFNPTSMPEITLVDRTNSVLFNPVKFALKQKGIMVVLHGESKSGKSTFCNHILREENPICVQGSNIKNEADFWGALAVLLAVPTKSTVSFGTKHSEESSRQDELSATIGGDLLPIGGSLKSKNATKEQASNSQSQTQEFAHSDILLIQEKIKYLKRPLIVDDFHWIKSDVQRQIIGRLKSVLWSGVTVILITVSEGAGDVLKHDNEGDLIGRLREIELPDWSNEFLGEIFDSGFEALNVAIEGESRAKFIRHARKNPMLMQWFCYSLCEQLGILQTQNAPRKVSASNEKNAAAIKNIATLFRGKYGSILEEGGQANWELRSGRKVNIYQLCLLSMRHINLNQSIGIKNIKERAEEIIAPNYTLPIEANIHNALSKLSKDMRSQLGPNSAVFYDEERRQVHILQPMFFVYLNWFLYPELLKEDPPL